VIDIAPNNAKQASTTRKNPSDILCRNLNKSAMHEANMMMAISPVIAIELTAISHIMTKKQLMRIK
jgi:hypothetical protein